MTAALIDWRPAPGVAPRGRRIVNHARNEATLLLRNGEQLILALVIPVGLLVAGLLLGDRVGLDAGVFPASVLALALWSTTFTSLAINTGFERRYGVLERLVATPLTRGDLVVGKALGTASVALGQVVLLAVVALALGWRPTPMLLGTLVVVVAAVLAMVCFASLALVLAGRLRAEATLALANLVYLAVAAGGGIVLPVGSYPAWAQAVLTLLPFGALGESLRQWSTGATPGPLALGVLLVWAVVSVLLARKAFRWTS